MAVPLLVRLVSLKNLHPILTHFTNGITPAALALALLARSTRLLGYIPLSHIVIPSCVDVAAWLMMVFVAGITPLTMATGMIDWKYRYDMRKVPVIQRKVITALAGYVFVIVYVVSHSISDYSLIALGIALFFFAVTGDYGGRLVHGAANASLLKKFQKPGTR
ncbi:hypothetical protein [Archaeoglobus neptunius]|uniref:hypothetical protein n=1 Tax=Archaeoglobus neptunius TaxID=2798580 RepID=UPI0019284236|nr:hypothetical protein [Archaeoglobus neptunius]